MRPTACQAQAAQYICFTMTAHGRSFSPCKCLLPLITSKKCHSALASAYCPSSQVKSVQVSKAAVDHNLMRLNASAVQRGSARPEAIFTTRKYTLPKTRTPACQSARGLGHRDSAPLAARQRASAPTRRWRPVRSPPCRLIERLSLESGSCACAQPSSGGSLDSHRTPGGEWAGSRSRAYDRQLLR